MICEICDGKMSHAFDHKVMAKHETSYWNCPKCGFMRVQDPYWLDEAYNESITSADTGLLARNISFSQKIIVLIDAFLGSKGHFLDYAGGYGIFTRLMRDAGFSFFHQDPYTENIFAKDFVFNENEFPINGITCFECLEHLNSPIKELQKIFSISKNVFFSTCLKDIEVPDKSWTYFGFSHGQHISFYSSKSLNLLAERFKLNVYTSGTLHFFTPLEIDSQKFKKLSRSAAKRQHPFTSRNRAERITRRLLKSKC